MSERTQREIDDEIAENVQPFVMEDGAHAIKLGVFNTVVDIKAYPQCIFTGLDGEPVLVDGPYGGDLNKVLQEVRDMCIRFERTISRTREDSEISAINKHAGSPVEVSKTTRIMVEQALWYCKESDGMFDITVGSVTPLWDFHNAIVPDPVSLKAALEHVDYTGVIVDPEKNTVMLSDPESMIDLGGTAKGFIADSIANRLTARGVKHAFINLGGNVRVIGGRPDGIAWRIGVRDPAKPDTTCTVVSAKDGSVVTSGLYERNFTIDGKTYHHILDARNGYPVESDVASATVVSMRSTDGDGYSTTLLLLGMDGAMDFIENHPSIEGILVDFNGNIRMSKGLGGK